MKNEDLKMLVWIFKMNPSEIKARIMMSAWWFIETENRHNNNYYFYLQSVYKYSPNKKT